MQLSISYLKMAKRMTQKLDEKFGKYPHTISYFLKVAFSQEGTEQKLKSPNFIRTKDRHRITYVLAR